jgi:TonB family protein
MSLLRATFVTGLILFASSGPLSLGAQDKVTSAKESEYPDSEDGLKKLFQDILDAAKAHDETKETQLLHSLILPPDTPWFKSAFGTNLGDIASSDYKDRVAGLESELRLIIENDIKQGSTNIKVKKITDPAAVDHPIDNILNDMEPQQALYEIILTDNTAPIRTISFDSKGQGFQSAGDPFGFFFYIEGQFRFITEFAFLSLPDGRPAPGHEIPRHPTIIHQTFPVYPPEARSAKVEGEVQMHLIVDSKGRIKKISVISGDSRLIKAAEDCVRQWRFRPVVIDGKPVESEIDVGVGFHYMG